MAEFRAVLALNNIGVSMMDRGCYRQALETMHDAVFLMKAVCRGSPSFVTGFSDRKPQDVESMLRRATERLLHPEQTEDASVEIMTLTVSDEGHSGDMESTLVVCPFNHEVLIALRLDDSFNFDALGQVESSIMSTCILHNFGLCCICRAKAADVSDLDLARLLHNAARIFELCQSVLSTQSTACRNGLHLKLLFFLGYVVLSAFIQVLLAEHRKSEALTHLPKLATLKAGVRVLGSSLLVDCNKPAPAA